MQEIKFYTLKFNYFFIWRKLFLLDDLENYFFLQHEPSPQYIGTHAGGSM